METIRLSKTSAPTYLNTEVMPAPLQAHAGRTESGGIAPPFCNLEARTGWVVSTTLRPLYSGQRYGVHCAGDYVCREAGQDG
jgi:hypothetical protein